MPSMVKAAMVPMVKTNLRSFFMRLILPIKPLNGPSITFTRSPSFISFGSPKNEILWSSDVSQMKACIWLSGIMAGTLCCWVVSICSLAVIFLSEVVPEKRV